MSLTALRDEGARAFARVPSFVLRSGAACVFLLTVLAGCAAEQVGEGGGSGSADDTQRSAGTTSTSESDGSNSASEAGESSLRSLPPLVADARWVSRDVERALKVSPTTYLRNHPSREVADEAWRRVVAAVPEADTPGMKDQFVCHAQFASMKQAWYLEPRRPAVGYGNTVLAGCNPGDVVDVG